MNSDNLSDEQKDTFEEQLDDIDSKALLAGIHSELMQIRVLLQGEDKTATESTQEIYTCVDCGERLPKDELEAHATRKHKAPPNMPLETYGKGQNH